MIGQKACASTFEEVWFGWMLHQAHPGPGRSSPTRRCEDLIYRSRAAVARSPAEGRGQAATFVQQGRGGSTLDPTDNEKARVSGPFII